MALDFYCLNYSNPSCWDCCLTLIWIGMKKNHNPWGSSVTMQTGVPNQMNSLTKMMGVGTAVGEILKPVVWPAAWGGSCSSSPACSGSVGLNTSSMHFAGCLPAWGRGCNVSVLGEPVRAHAEEVPTEKVWGQPWVYRRDSDQWGIVISEAFSYPQPQSICFRIPLSHHDTRSRAQGCKFSLVTSKPIHWENHNGRTWQGLCACPQLMSLPAGMLPPYHHTTHVLILQNMPLSQYQGCTYLY